jgi:hypothetical protein
LCYYFSYYIPTKSDIGAKLKVEFFYQEFHPCDPEYPPPLPANPTQTIIPFSEHISYFRKVVMSRDIDYFDRMLLTSQV